MSGNWNQSGYTAVNATEGVTFDEGLRKHMLSVYNYMGLGLAVTGLVAMLVANVPALYALFFEAAGKPTILGFIAMLSPILFVMYMGAVSASGSAAKLRGLFWIFCSLMGLSMASIFAYFTDASIARVFFVTAGTFAAMSLYGYTTKKDLTGFGNFLMMGVIGLLIASVVNIFMHAAALQFAVSVLGVLIFVGLTAYDTQKIKELYAES